MSSFFLIKKIAKNQEKVTGYHTDKHSPLPFQAPRPTNNNCSVVFSFTIIPDKINNDALNRERF
jgi:hypothetical protein